MQNAVRVIVADDHRYYRHGLVGLLGECGVEVVDDVPSGEAALTSVRRHDPDVVVMDVSMPGIGGVEATRQLVAERPGLPVLMLSVSQEDEDVLNGMLAGARGFVLKDGPVEDVVSGIEVLAAGGAVLSGRIAQRLLRHVTELGRGRPYAARLTDRENETLRLLAQDPDLEAVAVGLSTDLDGVRRTLTEILLKLQAQTRGDVAVRAIRDRIV